MTTIAKCRCCGSEAEFKYSSLHKAWYVSCNNEECKTIGPLHDPDGTKWNTLMAPAKPSPPEGAVKIELPILIDERGNWCANGWSGASVEDMIDSVYRMEVADYTSQRKTMTAYIVPPRIQEVEGEVE